MTATPLLDRVARAAEDDAAGRLAVARARADEIRSKAAESREVKRRAAADALRADLASAHQRACAEAGARTARAVLESRQRLLERALAVAESQIARLPESPDLVSCIQRLVGDALSYLETGHRTVRCNGASRPTIAAVLESLGCRDVTICVDDSLSTGAIVQSDDGRVSIDATLGGQLRSRRQSLAIAALAEPASASAEP